MKIFSLLLIKIIKFYRYFISPFIGNNCRYLPTCSEYFIQSLETLGFFKGTFNGIKRILTCHPIKILGGGEGFDPVENNKKESK